MRTADADLVARCKRGEPGAFEALYRQHASRLYNLAYRMVGNAADAEDLLQEIFLLAHRKLGSFKGQSALGTWLYRLATNLCLDHLRSKAARTAQATSSIDEESPSGRRYEPAAPAVQPAISVDLERAIARLPEGCRAAFVLHDVEGLEHREVAEVLALRKGRRSRRCTRPGSVSANGCTAATAPRPNLRSSMRRGPGWDFRNRRDELRTV